jgi:hypothetical protein
MKETPEPKKVWSTPVLIVYGDVERLTNEIKPKQPGSADDFGVTGISDP